MRGMLPEADTSSMGATPNACLNLSSYRLSSLHTTRPSKLIAALAPHALPRLRDIPSSCTELLARELPPASSGQEEGRTSLCTRGYFSVHALPMSPRCRTSLCIRGRPCPAPSRTTPPPYGPPAPEERMQRKCHGDALRINAMRINTMRINVAGVWTALGLQHLPLFWRHLLVTILIDLGHKLLGL